MQAWVTLATDDSYATGALVLGRSLHRVNTTKKLIVMITETVTDEMRESLSLVFDATVLVDPFDSNDAANLALINRPELGITFTKLHCWRLTSYRKCVFLDADTLVLQNCDELFERPEFTAAPDVGWPDCFNSGVFVFVPSHDTYNALVQLALAMGSFDGGDQGLLNTYFNNWYTSDAQHRLPFTYNMSSNSIYSYKAAIKHFEKNVKIVHFLGQTKPWHHSFDASTGGLQIHGYPGHATEHLQTWWDILTSDVLALLHRNTDIMGHISLQYGFHASYYDDSLLDLDYSLWSPCTEDTQVFGDNITFANGSILSSHHNHDNHAQDDAHQQQQLEVIIQAKLRRPMTEAEKLATYEDSPSIRSVEGRHSGILMDSPNQEQEEARPPSPPAETAISKTGTEKDEVAIPSTCKTQASEFEPQRLSNRERSPAGGKSNQSRSDITEIDTTATTDITSDTLSSLRLTHSFGDSAPPSSNPSTMAFVSSIGSSPLESAIEKKPGPTATMNVPPKSILKKRRKQRQISVGDKATDQPRFRKISQDTSAAALAVLQRQLQENATKDSGEGYDNAAATLRQNTTLNGNLASTTPKNSAPVIKPPPADPVSRKQPSKKPVVGLSNDKTGATASKENQRKSNGIGYNGSTSAVVTETFGARQKSPEHEQLKHAILESCQLFPNTPIDSSVGPGSRETPPRECALANSTPARGNSSMTMLNVKQQRSSVVKQSGSRGTLQNAIESVRTKALESLSASAGSLNVSPQLPSNLAHLPVTHDAFPPLQPGISSSVGHLHASSSGHYAPQDSWAHQRAWEAGHVDFTGRDAFDNIFRHLSAQLDESVGTAKSASPSASSFKNTE